VEDATSEYNSVDEVLGEGFPGRIVKRFGHRSSLVPMAYISRVPIPVVYIFENFRLIMM
jgi:hypothetical protein